MIDVAVVMEWVSRLAGLSGVAAVIGVVWTIRHNVKGDERLARAQEAEDRRDTIADRDAVIDQLQEERDARDRTIERLRAERDSERAGRLTAEHDADLYRRHNRILVDQIYRGDPPPPRPLPTD